MPGCGDLGRLAADGFRFLRSVVGTGLATSVGTKRAAGPAMALLPVWLCWPGSFGKYCAVTRDLSAKLESAW